MGIFDNLFHPSAVDDYSVDEYSDYPPDSSTEESMTSTLDTTFWVAETTTVSTTSKTEISTALIYVACGIGIGVLLLLIAIIAIKSRCCRCKVSNVSGNSGNTPPQDNQSDVVVTMSQITHVANNSAESQITQHNKAE